MSKPKPAQGTLDDIYCVSHKGVGGKKGKKVKVNLTGYVEGPKGGIRIIGVCDEGHKVTSFIGKDRFAALMKSGKITGGGCPYASPSTSAAPSTTGSAEDFASESMVEGGAKRRSRGSRKGSRKSRGSRKSHGSRKGSRKSRGSRKSHGSRKGSRKSRGSRKHKK